jgi:uncharacterized protein DUF5753
VVTGTSPTRTASSSSCSARRPYARVIGTPQVHVEQLNRLLEMSELPNVSIHVVPLDAGSHAALEYTFTMLYIARARASIVYIESLTTADYLARTQHTQTYNLAFESARRAALDADRTRDLLTQVRDDLEGAADGD